MRPFGKPDVVDGHYIGDRTPSTRAEPPPPPRSTITMPKDQLTEADMADYRVTYRSAYRAGPNSGRTIRAAYVTSEDRHPDMLVFKDSEHRTVYMVNRAELLEVERLGQSEHVEDRKAVSEQVAGPISGGFVPASQVMREMQGDPRTEREIIEDPVYPRRAEDFR